MRKRDYMSVGPDQRTMLTGDKPKYNKEDVIYSFEKGAISMKAKKYYLDILENPEKFELMSRKQLSWLWSIEFDMLRKINNN